MARYDVYMNNIPKVSEDGSKSLPIPPHRTQEFSQLDEAQKFASEHKDKFERVTLIHTDDEGKQKMVERYMDGEHIVPEKKD